MTTRRSFLVVGLSVAAASLLPPARGVRAQAHSPAPAYILGATAITQIFGDGQRLVAVALEYDRPMDAAVLDPSLYAVEGCSIVRVYTNAAAELTAVGSDGPFGIVELSPDDEAARLYRQKGRSTVRRPAGATVTVTPVGAAKATTDSAAEKSDGPPDFGAQSQSIPTTAAKNLVLDDFTQAAFQDAETGDTPRDCRDQVFAKRVGHVSIAGI